MVENSFVIDSHCHVYPEKIADKAVAGTCNFYGLNAAGDGRASTLVDMGKKSRNRPFYSAVRSYDTEASKQYK